MKISQSVTKKDHAAKVGGHAIYVADHPKQGVLFGKLVRSSVPKAKIAHIHLPALPEGYFSVDHRDVPGENRVQVVLDDTPVFVADTVEYIGDPILMIVGPEEDEVSALAAQVAVDYEPLPAVLRIDDHDKVFFDYHYGKGDVDAAFADADKVFEETFETGYQEQAYLETQGMIAEPLEGGMRMRGSLQCPYYVHTAVRKALGVKADDIRVLQDVTGGGFGGKEAFPSILACQVAVAANKAQKPVRVVFDRREDMEFTSKRHPSRSVYKVAVKDGRVTAMDIDVTFNAGAYTTLTPVVLQRGIICASGVYAIDHLKVHGKAVKTNTIPCGAFRGFGGPQTFFAVERIMDHIAKDLGLEALAFKKAHLAKQGDSTSTSGLYHFPVPLPAMIEEVEAASSYADKRAAYDKPQSGRYRRGIGISLVFHGAGFTGAGERDLIKAVARIRKNADGTVDVLTSNSDIGQGLKTTFAKIVATELDCPLERVRIENPDTAYCADSGPTVASRSLMVVGELLRRASIRLRAQWSEGSEQIIEERFVEPDFMLPFDLETFHGDAYPTYAWAAYAIELEVDTLTGTHKVLGAWGSFDVGTPIDENIVIGQMEGGFLQGIGYASLEQMRADKGGRIRNHRLADYIVPTSMDVPKLEAILHVEPYPFGPYGAKGAGELPLVGAPAAYTAALEQALRCDIHHIPFSAEDSLSVLREESR